MPLTSAAFTVGAFGMIGLPPTAGFISKWQLGTGALASEHPWVLWMLVGSSLLNAAYFLPVVYALWFADPDEVDPKTLVSGDAESADSADPLRVKEPKSLLAPALITAGLTLFVGIAASLAFAPLQVARFIAEGVLD